MLEQVCVVNNKKRKSIGTVLTSLVFSKINFLWYVDFVSIGFAVKAIVLFQRNGEFARSRIDRAPVCNRLNCVHFRYNIIKATFAE